MKLGIYGGGGLGREMIDFAQEINASERRWSEIIIIDDTKPEGELCSCRRMPLTLFLTLYKKNDIEIVIAVGEPVAREQLANRIKSNDYPFATLISATAKISSSAKYGAGLVAKSGAFVSCDAKLGDNVILQDYCVIGHDVQIGNNCILSSFTSLAGHVNIGNNIFFGMQSSVRENVSIGDNSIIGMGAIVLKDVPPYLVMAGNPARMIRKNENRQVFS